MIEALAKNIDLKKSADKRTTRSMDVKKITENDIDLILERLSSDIDFLGLVGIECSIKNKGNCIELTETLLSPDRKPVVLYFFLDNKDRLFCNYRDSMFEYKNNFIKNSIIRHSMGV